MPATVCYAAEAELEAVVSPFSPVSRPRAWMQWRARHGFLPMSPFARKKGNRNRGKRPRQLAPPLSRHMWHPG